MWMRRRPDIQAAEATFGRRQPRIGVAQVPDLFPRFTLDGLIGSAGWEVASDALYWRARKWACRAGYRLVVPLTGRKVQSRLTPPMRRPMGLVSRLRAKACLLALPGNRKPGCCVISTRRSGAYCCKALLMRRPQAVEQARERYEQGFIGYFDYWQPSRS